MGRRLRSGRTTLQRSAIEVIRSGVPRTIQTRLSHAKTPQSAPRCVLLPLDHLPPPSTPTSSVCPSSHSWPFIRGFGQRRSTSLSSPAYMRAIGL